MTRLLLPHSINLLDIGQEDVLATEEAAVDDKVPLDAAEEGRVLGVGSGVEAGRLAGGDEGCERDCAGRGLAKFQAGGGSERTRSEDLLEELVRELRVLLLRLAFKTVHLRRGISFVALSASDDAGTHLVHVCRLVVTAVEEDLPRVQPYNVPLISNDVSRARKTKLTLVRKEHDDNLGTPRPPIDEIAVKEQRMTRRRLARQRKEMNKVVELPMRVPNPYAQNRISLTLHTPKQGNSHINHLPLWNPHIHQRRLLEQDLLRTEDNLPCDPPGQDLALFEPLYERVDKLDRGKSVREAGAGVGVFDGGNAVR